MKLHPDNLKASAELLPQSGRIQDPFWSRRQQINADTSIFHQWEQFERTGRLDNFRKVAGTVDGFHEGFFYNDSDVHKWAEAAALILKHSDNPQLRDLLDQYVELVCQAQEPDGYLFTYNQLNFPGQRWVNLQIEHELYTLGHFIEAGIAAYQLMGDSPLFAAARKSADLVTSVFNNAPSLQTPGHQEIEIALIRLYQVSQNDGYLNMAEQFLERRGKTALFGLHLVRQFTNQVSRSGEISRSKPAEEGKPALGFDMSENLSGREPRFISLRANVQFLSGRYHQQHTPIRKMLEPVGHAVRWSYLQTSVAMLHRETGDPALLAALEESWERMVRKKMYITGGIGSLPVVEGFGRPYELDNEFAYAETCAAIATIFWNWQMTLITGDAKYADLTEWQLYNAAGVGIALHGKAYLYRNPLLSAGKLTRKPWFDTACCPGNISRLWAQLGKYLLSEDRQGLIIHQYIGYDAELKLGPDLAPIHLKLRSGFPWNGDVTIQLTREQPTSFCLKLRVPGWAKSWQVSINGNAVQSGQREAVGLATAGGYSPENAFYLEIDRKWNRETTIDLRFEMAVCRHQPHPKVKNNIGKTALSRGPVVYCIEDIDNPGAEIPGAVTNGNSSVTECWNHDLPEEVITLESQDRNGNPLLFIPYYCWANREPSKMQVWVETI